MFPAVDIHLILNWDDHMSKNPHINFSKKKVTGALKLLELVRGMVHCSQMMSNLLLSGTYKPLGPIEACLI